MKFRCQRCSEPSQRGFTLVEVMLVLLLSSVLILGLGSLFSLTTVAYRQIEGQLRLHESASYALQQIAAHLRSAGDFGCAARFSMPLKTLRGGWQQLFEFDLTAALGGIGGDTFSLALASQRLALSAPTDNRKTYVRRRGIRANPYTPNANSTTSALLVTDSDIIVMRRLGTPHFRLSAPITAVDEIQVRLNDANGDGRINSSDFDRFGFSGTREPILILGDCTHRTLFRVRTMRRQGQVVKLKRSIGTGSSPFVNQSIPVLPLGESFQTDAVVGPVETTVFFIATGRGLNNQSQPVLSLWKKTSIGRPQEMVEGIERLVFFAGMDTDGDQIPNQYQSFSKIVDFTSVVSIRFMVVANSVNTVPTNIAGEPELLRRAYSSTVWLRNL